MDRPLSSSAFIVVLPQGNISPPELCFLPPPQHTNSRCPPCISLSPQLPALIVTAQLRAPSCWCCSAALQAGEEQHRLLRYLQHILFYPGCGCAQKRMHSLQRNKKWRLCRVVDSPLLQIFPCFVTLKCSADAEQTDSIHILVFRCKWEYCRARARVIQKGRTLQAVPESACKPAQSILESLHSHSCKLRNQGPRDHL